MTTGRNIDGIPFADAAQHASAFDGITTRPAALFSSANVAALSTLAAPAFEMLAEAQFSRPTPCVASIGHEARSSSDDTPGTDETPAVESMGLLNWATSNEGEEHLGIELRYRVQNTTRTVWFDARPGNYQLPPVQYVRLRAFGYNSGAGATVMESLIAGALSPGLCSNPSRPRITCHRTFTASQSIGLVVPRGARWFDLYPDAAAGVFTATGPSGYVVRDMATPNYQPPWGPIELPNYHVGSITVVNGIASEQECTAQFFLEL